MIRTELSEVRILEGTRVNFHQHVHSGCGSHPAPSAMGIGVSLLRIKDWGVKLTTLHVEVKDE